MKITSNACFVFVTCIYQIPFLSSSFILQRVSPPPPFHHPYHDPRCIGQICETTSYPLFAKTVTKKKKNNNESTTSTTGGGFGAKVATGSKKKASSSSSSKKEDHFAMFPPLEENVQQTLIPSTVEDATVAGELSDEIYDRLAQIYGFPNFNFVQAASDGKQEEVEDISFGDMLKMSSESESSSSSLLDIPTSSSSSSSSLDLDDLIASATGEATSSSSSQASPAKTKSESIPIENLPPFTQFRVLHVDPMIICIDDFLTSSECDTLIAHSDTQKNLGNRQLAPIMSRSRTVGKDSKSQSQRTSTTWYHHFQGTTMAPLMAKSCRLLGLDTIDRWEEPQTVRYRGTEKFTWHLDALSPTESELEKGGQRVLTLLVYLNSLGDECGGTTMFRDLGIQGEFLKVPPKKGSALIFFPAAGGIPNTPFDIRTLHAGEAVTASSPNDKWIAQLWLRQTDAYKPTAPPGNTHAAATEDITNYCLDPLNN